VVADGLGWFGLVNGVTHQLTSTGTVSATVLTSALTSCGSGGSVYVASGVYSASISVPTGVRLVLEKGATGVSYTVAASATCLITDYNAGASYSYVAGVLTYSSSSATGNIWSSGNVTANNYASTQPIGAYTYMIYPDPNFATNGLYDAKAANGTVTWTSTNYNTVESSVLTVMTSGTLELQNVPFNYSLTVPSNCLVHENLNSQSLWFGNSAQAVTSQYTITNVLDSLGARWFISQDQNNIVRFLSQTFSTTWQNTMQSIPYDTRSNADPGNPLYAHPSKIMLRGFTASNVTTAYTLNITRPFLEIDGGGSIICLQGQSNATLIAFAPPNGATYLNDVYVHDLVLYGNQPDHGVNAYETFDFTGSLNGKFETIYIYGPPHYGFFCNGNNDKNTLIDTFVSGGDYGYLLTGGQIHMIEPYAMNCNIFGYVIHDSSGVDMQTPTYDGGTVGGGGIKIQGQNGPSANINIQFPRIYLNTGIGIFIDQFAEPMNISHITITGGTIGNSSARAILLIMKTGYSIDDLKITDLSCYNGSWAYFMVIEGNTASGATLSNVFISNCVFENLQYPTYIEAGITQVNVNATGYFSTYP
jgi:hypothetical protein